MNRPFQFDTEKAIQAVAFLLRREPCRRMNYMRLLKVLYIAEREILGESSKPLTGSPVIAMERGPVLEDVYSLIRGQPRRDIGQWSQFFRVEHYELVMEHDPGAGRLSKFVTRKLDEVAERHIDDDEWALVELTHQLPEWRENDPGKSSKPIPLSSILAALGRLDDMGMIVDRARADEHASRFFAEHL